MSTISSLFAQTSSYETFVSQLVELESQKKYKYEAEQDDLKESKTAVSTISSAISDLQAKIEEFTDSSNNSFELFSSSSSDSSVVRIDSASGLTRENSFNITVDRLATRDISLDTVRTGADTDLSALGDGFVTLTIGDKTENISVLTTKDDGAGGFVAMTNQEILESFAEQISTLFGDEASANVFTTNDTDVQFSVQSLATGFDNRIQFSGATGVAAQIIGDMSKLTPEEDLNAQFTIDGVTFERSSNEVTDAIDGVEFTLLKDTGEQEQMTVSRNIEGSKSNLKDFIEAFNELNETIRERTFLNGETGNAGPLQNYRTVRNLSTNLRQMALLTDSSITSGQIRNFAEMGISFEKDGKMKIDDTDLLEEVLSERPEEIAAFFQSASSPISNMDNLMESYTETDGILSALTDRFDTRLDRLDDLIKKEDDYLADYEDKQRLIFNNMDAMLEEAQAQFDQVANFTYTTYSYS